MMNLTNKLLVSDWRLMLYLGVSDQERLVVQPVSVDIALHFKSGQPVACLDDNINSTISYSTMLEFLRPKLEAQSWHLIEHLAYFVAEQLYKWLPKDIISSVIVKVTKLHPPVKDLNAASFECRIDD